MGFLALFVAQNRDFGALDAFRFGIITCQWCQSILIDHMNLFIYGIYQFSSVSEPLLLRNGILGPFCASLGVKMPCFGPISIIALFYAIEYYL